MVCDSAACPVADSAQRLTETCWPTMVTVAWTLPRPSGSRANVTNWLPSSLARRGLSTVSIWSGTETSGELAAAVASAAVVALTDSSGTLGLDIAAAGAGPPPSADAMRAPPFWARGGRAGIQDIGPLVRGRGRSTCFLRAARPRRTGQTGRRSAAASRARIGATTLSAVCTWRRWL